MDLTIYVYDPERKIMVDKATREPMNSPDAEFALPHIWPDLPGYQSPITGEWIEGRRARKYDLERHNCVDANDFSKPRPLRNERFARKYGLTHLMEQ